MNPPVSDGVQGAYFVAAFFPGLILGGVALVFRELTEGLGCILGGFCFSMWLLCLKSGGLLDKDWAKGIFIGVFCAAVYALSFISYTRPYALIGSTAFAGATATVLGIDCFSRAGLKEFWVYIWGALCHSLSVPYQIANTRATELNDKIFPTATRTYPVTRGIRVELAITIVICLVGLVSQFKLWKVIKERRKVQDAEIAEEKRKMDELETEMGRKLEEDRARELARWEALYGDEPLQENGEKDTSALNSGQKGPREMVKMLDDAMELRIFSQPESNGSQTLVADEKREKVTTGTTAPTLVDESERSTELPCYDDIDKTIPQDDDRPLTPESKAEAVRNSVSEVDGGQDTQSVWATVDNSESLVSRLSRRLSGISLPGALSPKSGNKRDSQGLQSVSEETLLAAKPVTPATSVQVLADLADMAEVQSVTSNAETPMSVLDSGKGGARPPQLDAEPENDNLKRRSTSDGVLQSESQNNVCGESNNGPISMSTVEAKPGADAERSEATSSTKNDRPRTDMKQHEKGSPDAAASVLPIGRVLSLAPVTIPPSTPSQKTIAKGASSHEARSRPSFEEETSLSTGAVEKLPGNLSPVVSSYRTNEWVKHLADAEAPEPEPIDTTTSTDREDSEKPAPVIVEQLQQTVASTLNRPAGDTGLRVQHTDSSLSPGRNLSSSNLSRLSGHASIPPDDASVASGSNLPRLVTPSPIHPSPRRSTSSPAGLRTTRRSASSPFLNTSLAAVPIHESEEATFHDSSTLAVPSLLAQRSSMLRNRMLQSSMSNRDHWRPRSESGQSVSSASSRLSSQRSLPDEDDDSMPLSQRRRLLHQHSILSEMSFGASSSVHERLPGDYPGAHRSASATAASMAAWRQSIKEELTRSRSSLNDVDAARSGLLEQRRRAQAIKQQQDLASQRFQESIVERMQRGEMHDLHREALRRMQAVANQKIT